MPRVLKRHMELVDEWIKVSDRKAFEAVRELAKDQNFLVGPSSGAVYAAAKEVAQRLMRGKLVLVFGDDGRKYMSLYTQFNIFQAREFRRLVAKASYPPAFPNHAFSGPHTAD